MPSIARLEAIGATNAPVADLPGSVAPKLPPLSSAPRPAGDVVDDARVFVTHDHVEHYAQRLRERCDQLFADGRPS